MLPYFRPDGRGGFWEINSASHVDAPQQFRLIELMDNGDGTLSLFGTVLDHASPVAPPRPGTPGARMTHRQLASIGRFLSLNATEVQRRTPRPDGVRPHQNVELVLRDPRRAR